MTSGEQADRDILRGLGRVEGKVDRIIAEGEDMRADQASLHEDHDRLKEKVGDQGKKTAYMAGGAAGFGAVVMKIVDWFATHGNGPP